MAKAAISKKFQAAKKMPPLLHSIPSECFDIRKSAVARWLCSQPEIMQYVFDKVSSNSNGFNFIEFDAEAGTWQGVDYRD